MQSGKVIQIHLEKKNGRNDIFQQVVFGNWLGVDWQRNRPINWWNKRDGPETCICESSMYKKSDISNEWGNDRQCVKGFQQLVNYLPENKVHFHIQYKNTF